MLDAARRPTFLRAPRAAVVGGLAAVAAAAWLPVLSRPLSPDEGGFLMVAAQWGPGTSLYGDYWVDRPPLLIGLFQLADLAGGAVALRVFGILAVVVSVLLAGELGRLLAPGRPIAAVAASATAAIFLATPFFGTTEVNGELLALPFLLGGLVALARRWWAAAGVLAVAAAAVKQSEVDVAVAAVVAIGALVWQRAWATAARGAAAFVAAALASTAVILAWAAANGTDPAGLWDAVVIFRGRAAEVISASASSATDERAHLLLTSFLVSGAAGVVLVALVALVPGRRGRRRAAAAPLDVRLVAVALLAWETVVVVAGGSYWLHYLIATVPALVLLVVATVRHRPERWRWLAGAVAYAGVTALASVVALAVVGRPVPDDAGVKQYLAAAAGPGDTAVVAFGDPAILQAAGLQSPYPLLWSLPVRVRDPELTELTRVLAGPDRPTWVVVDGTSLDTWGVDATAAQPVLDREYIQERVVGNWTVYHVAGREH
ncbi:hypothetical protein [Nocardioides aquiterrae]|uniref:Glycosyltransferase RgtA/B/C/D-like domain-containing protein n=1 Tax=Nocardioides aquiterrae TaxID=203799 RepID=A0ABN1U949_9ACTN